MAVSYYQITTLLSAVMISWSSLKPPWKLLKTTLLHNIRFSRTLDKRTFGVWLFFKFVKKFNNKLDNLECLTAIKQLISKPSLWVQTFDLPSFLVFSAEKRSWSLYCFNTSFGSRVDIIGLKDNELKALRNLAAEMVLRTKERVVG